MVPTSAARSPSPFDDQRLRPSEEGKKERGGKKKEWVSLVLSPSLALLNWEKGLPFPPYLLPFLSRRDRVSSTGSKLGYSVPRRPTGSFNSTYRRNYYYACEKVDIELACSLLNFLRISGYRYCRVFHPARALFPTSRVY